MTEIRANALRLTILFFIALFASMHLMPDVVELVLIDHDALRWGDKLGYAAIAVLSVLGSLAVLVPGLLYALLFARQVRSGLSVLLIGLLLTVLVMPFGAVLVEIITGIRLTGFSFCYYLLALCGPAIFMLSRKRAQAVPAEVPWGWVHLSCLTIAIIAAFLSHKIIFESLNADGAHSMLSALQFIERGMPFWPANTPNELGGYPAVHMVSELLLQTTFVRLYGPVEASLRLAYFPGLFVLMMLVFMLVVSAGKLARSGLWCWCLAGAFALYSWVLAYATSYDPYYADMAMPMVREPLIIIGVLGFVWFFEKQRLLLAGAISLLVQMSVPSGLILIFLFLGAYLLVARGRAWKQVGIAGACVLALFVLLGALEVLLIQRDIIYAGGEFGPKAILRRLRHVTFFNYERMLYWVLPCGILPAVGLFLWRGADRVAIALALMTIGYVCFFYVQAYRVLPHHFAPAMIVPLVVFWRHPLIAKHQRVVSAMAVVGIATAWVLSWPPTTAPHREGREIGQRVSLARLVGNRAHYSVDPVELSTAIGGLDMVFPPNWSDEEIKSGRVIAPIALYYYATLPKHPDQHITYMKHPHGALVGDGRELLGTYEGWVVTTATPEQVEADLAAHLDERSIPTIYAVPRYITFSIMGPHDPRKVFDLAELVGLR